MATKAKGGKSKSSATTCWKGYKKVPGKKPGSKGSCTKA